MVALAGTCSATSTGLGLAVRDATISTLGMLVLFYSNPVHCQRVLAVNLHCYYVTKCMYSPYSHISLDQSLHV